MTAFARRAGVAVVNAAIEHNSGSDSGSNRGIKNVAESASSAPMRFRESGCIRVVVHLDGHVVNRPDFLGQREVPPARQIRRIENDARLRVKRTRRTDSYASKSSAR